MFTRQTEEHNERAVFLEYAWDMAWCDPCAADPLSRDELRSLGVFWLGNDDEAGRRSMPQPAQNVFVTRLHVRYDTRHFPEDLMFQETGDRQNYQGRFVIRHPWQGEASCDLTQYHAGVRERQERSEDAIASYRQALAIDPNERMEWRLANIIMQQRAAWLLSRTDRIFLDCWFSPETQARLAGIVERLLRQGYSQCRPGELLCDG